MPSRQRVNGATYSSYKVDEEMTVPQRTAHFLDWYAKRAPKRLVTLPDLTKIVNILPKRPGPDSKDVLLQKSRNQAVKKILEAEYDCGLISSPGRGIRASVDAEDFSVNCLRSTVKRYQSAGVRVNKQAGMVRTSQLTNAETKAFVSKVKRASKELTAEALLERLPLPPKPEA